MTEKGEFSELYQGCIPLSRELEELGSPQRPGKINKKSV